MIASKTTGRYEGMSVTTIRTPSATAPNPILSTVFPAISATASSETGDVLSYPAKRNVHPRNLINAPAIRSSTPTPNHWRAEEGTPNISRKLLYNDNKILAMRESFVTQPGTFLYGGVNEFCNRSNAECPDGEYTFVAGLYVAMFVAPAFVLALSQVVADAAVLYIGLLVAVTVVTSVTR